MLLLVGLRRSFVRLLSLNLVHACRNNLIHPDAIANARQAPPVRVHKKIPRFTLLVTEPSGNGNRPTDISHVSAIRAADVQADQFASLHQSIKVLRISESAPWLRVDRRGPAHRPRPEGHAATLSQANADGGSLSFPLPATASDGARSGEKGRCTRGASAAQLIDFSSTLDQAHF